MPFYPKREHVLVTCAVLAITISSTQIALERGLLHYYQKYMGSYSEPWPPRLVYDWPRPSKRLSMMPANLTSIPTDLIIACGALGVFAGAVAIFRFLAIVNTHTGERDRVAQVAEGPYASNRVCPDRARYQAASS